MSYEDSSSEDEEPFLEVVPLYANAFHFNRSPATASSTETHSYASIQHRRNKPSFSLHEKKMFSPIQGPLQNIYVNIPIVSCQEQINSHPFYENLPPSCSIYVNLPPASPQESSPIIPSLSETNDKGNNAISTTTDNVEQVEVNMVPNCRDKSNLYRTKMPCSITQVLPILTSTRPRRGSQSIRRHRSRPTRSYRHTNRSTGHSHGLRPRRSRPHIHSRARPTPMATDRSKKIVPKKPDAIQSVSNEIYNEIDTAALASTQHDEDDHHSECETRQDQVITEDPDHSRPTMLFSTSENVEFDLKDDTSQEEDHQEDFVSHNTFEDFLFRRRPRRQSSSVSTTIYSNETSSSSRSPTPTQRSRGMTLGLARSDRDFIQTIIERKSNDRYACDRITALKEAYLRAATKQGDLAKRHAKAPTHDKRKMPTTHAFITSKIRDELEKYDELPMDLRSIFDHGDIYHAHEALPSTAHRIIHFLVTLKRRAQTNFQQLKKGFQTFRARLLLEMMTVPSTHYEQRHRTLHYMPRHHPISRAYSNISQPHYYAPTSRTSLEHRDTRYTMATHSRRPPRIYRT